MAWLSGYNYRKPLTLSGGCSGNKTNYQMLFNLHKSTAEYEGYPLSVESKNLQGLGFSSAKPIIVGSQRYIVTTCGLGSVLGDYITVWEADECWNRNTDVGHYWTSSNKSGECYVRSFSVIPNTIIIDGPIGTDGHKTFIAGFNTSSHTWDWHYIETITAGITDIIYADSPGCFYICPSAVNPGYYNWVWKSTVENLLSPDNWTQVNFPTWSGGWSFINLAYRGSGHMSVLQANFFYYYRVLNWQLSDDTFTTILTSTDATTYTENIFPYIDSWGGRIGLVLPVRTPSNHWDIRYSDDGINYTHITDLNWIGGTGGEIQCDAMPIDNDLMLVFNSKDGHPEGQINVYKLDGTLVETHDSIFTHYTEHTLVYDGDRLIRGGEQFWGAGSDNQVLVITKNADIYLNNHALNWSGTIPNDISFTKSDGTTPLDYYIESSDANNAKVWVEFDTITGGCTNSTFYMYYGNAGASSASSFNNTFDSYTRLLLPFHGADSSTTFIDLAGHTFTARGTAQIDQAQYKFGGSSGLFDGNSDWIDTPDSNDWNLGAGAFTIDFWIRFKALPGVGVDWQVYEQRVVSPTYAIQFSIYNVSGVYNWLIQYCVNDTWHGSLVLKASPGLSVNTWYHVAFVRSGNSWYIFQDGTQCGTTVTASDTLPDVAAVLHIGAGAGYINGWIDECRLSKGIARWTANFTPVTPAAPWGTWGSEELFFQPFRNYYPHILAH